MHSDDFLHGLLLKAWKCPRSDRWVDDPATKNTDMKNFLSLAPLESRGPSRPLASWKLLLMTSSENSIQWIPETGSCQVTIEIKTYASWNWNMSHSFLLKKETRSWISMSILPWLQINSAVQVLEVFHVILFVSCLGSTPKVTL